MKLSDTNFLLVISQFLLLVKSGLSQQQVWTDEHVIRALGDHGDRIADLEKLVKTLTLEYSALKQDVTALTAENQLLRDELQNITGSCNLIQNCLSSTYLLTTTNVSAHAQITQPTTTSHQIIKYPDANQTSTPALPTTKSTTPALPAAKSTTPVLPTTKSASPTTTAAKTTRSTIKSSSLSPTTSGQKDYANCNEALARNQANGTYNIAVGDSGVVIPVFCEHFSGEDWLVIQRRKDGSENFNRNWDDYKQGFGSPDGEMWLGNEYLCQMTSAADYTLRIDMDDWGGNHIFAEYEHFQVEDEWNLYSLRVGSYTGNAGDSFHYSASSLLMHHGMPFSTPDRDHDYSFMNCADKLHSGWWFNSCYSSNLNGQYLSSAYGHRQLGETYGEPTLMGTGIEWYPYRHRQYSMRRVEMKLKLLQTVPLLG